jgi:hypothetical protein
MLPHLTQEERRGISRRQGPQGIDMLARHTQRLAAGGKNAWPAGDAHHLWHQLRAGGNQELAVVENQQDLARGELGGNPLQQRLAPRFADAKLTRNRVCDVVWLQGNGQVDEPGAGWPLVADGAPDLQRQGRLSRSSRSDNRYQGVLLDGDNDGVQVACATNDWRIWRWQVANTRGSWARAWCRSSQFHLSQPLNSGRLGRSPVVLPTIDGDVARAQERG